MVGVCLSLWRMTAGLPLASLVMVLLSGLLPAAVGDIVQEGTYLDTYVLAKMSNASVLANAWFGPTEDPCANNWPAVVCNDNGSAIAEVLMNGYGLGGPLSSEIGFLTSLQRLRLDSNHLSGSLPSTLANLTALQELNLSNNNFSGALPDFSRLTSLVSLNVSNNKLQGNLSAPLWLFPCTSFAGNPDLNTSGCGTVFRSPPPSAPSEPPAAAGGVVGGGGGGGGGSSSSIGPVIGGVVAGIVVLALVVLAFVLLRRRQMAKPDALLPDVDNSAEVEEMLEGVNLAQLKRYTAAELAAATDSWSPAKELGRGGFSTVYLGTFPNNVVVAVKRLKKQRSEREKSFFAEVELISRAAHRHLLRLLGFCADGRERALVYPFMPHGSVASHFPESRPEGEAPMEWPRRRRVALGAARALAYMHCECNPRIVHRDVKAANVLLDDEWEAVVGDFGLARLLGVSEDHATTRVRGTLSHIAPEYLRSGHTSEKSDVFGYGVFLLELISGHFGADLVRRAEREQLTLRDWVTKCLQEGRLRDLVEEGMQAQPTCDLADVQVIVQVALICMEGAPSGRPAMDECASFIAGDYSLEVGNIWRVYNARLDERLAAPVEYQSFGQTDSSTGSLTYNDSSTLHSDAGWELSAPR